MSQGFVNQGTLPAYLNPTPTVQRLLSGSGTYTTPANVSYIQVYIKGAGGGGGNGGGAGGGGGGEGGTSISLYVSPASTYSYAVGSGGAAATTGGSTTFGSMTAVGGFGNASSGSVVGGSASGGNITNTQGAAGANPSFVGSPYYGGQGGGEGGGVGGQSGAGGTASSNSGGGGGGGGSTGGSGGSGGSGIIVVEEFYQPVSPASATGAGNYVLGNSPTLTTPNVVGVTNASNAAVGSLGEYISSVVLNASAIAVGATGVVKDLTFLTLSPGDWDVGANIFYNVTGATMTSIAGWVNTTSATFPDNSRLAIKNGAFTGNDGFCVPGTRINVTVSTVVYLTGYVTYSAGPPTMSGQIYARRVR